MVLFPIICTLSIVVFVVYPANPPIYTFPAIVPFALIFSMLKFLIVAPFVYPNNPTYDWEDSIFRLLILWLSPSNFPLNCKFDVPIGV